MNAYIPVLEQQPPRGFICNATWRHVGPQKVVGHTPPKIMEIVCPCVECAAERVAELDDLFRDLLEGESTDQIDRYVLGPVWFGHDAPLVDVSEYVGLYDRANIENK